MKLLSLHSDGIFHPVNMFVDKFDAYLLERAQRDSGGGGLFEASLPDTDTFWFSTWTPEARSWMATNDNERYMNDGFTYRANFVRNVLHA